MNRRNFLSLLAGLTFPTLARRLRPKPRMKFMAKFRYYPLPDSLRNAKIPIIFQRHS